VNVRRSTTGSHVSPLPNRSMPVAERSILNEEAFCRLISLERKRSERSKKPFLLMLLDLGERRSSATSETVLDEIMTALATATRETDLTGWYKSNHVVGVMFTEISIEERDPVVRTMISRLSEMLRKRLTPEQFSQLSISFHAFPEEWDHELRERPSDPALYPDLSQRENARKASNAMKRVMDVFGSVLALAVFSPIFLAIAIAIKATSKGPIFFRQRRIGQHGEAFTFLKFRSMYVNNDSRIHQEYVQSLIAGTAKANASDGNGEAVYKLTRDPRITSFGAFLRKTSLDELPQFMNVLRGEMSLVGPRPPVPYEVKAYDVWHRRRLLEAKPGITGLWQVNGRSRVKFDDMVRLDLQYARHWSPWMDLKILLRTPAAVVLGEGAH
jgi:exopolysaccharide biosynthesis polyprenyl glycosylphosphotransferase